MRRFLFRLLELYWRVFRPVVLGSRGLVVRGEGPSAEVLLVRLTYYDGWHLPGGGVARGESFREAWLRELREECGLEALDADLFGLYFTKRKGKSDQVAVYLTRHARAIEDAKADPEIAEMRYFKAGEIPAEATPATRRRIEEFREAGRSTTDRW